jgi:ABC-2 type transport system permease protein
MPAEPSTGPSTPTSTRTSLTTEAAGRLPGAVIAVRTATGAARSAVLWGYVFGLTVASSALGYVSAYKTLAQRARFAALFGSNAGLAAINGPAHQIQTVAGYTVWKSFMFLMVLGAVWGLLTATRLLRGEEDAGRWELLLAGHTTRRGAVVQALAGLSAGVAVLWALTALITAIAGHSSKVHIAPGPAMFFALALVAPAAMFLAAGALASQLAPSRRQAAGYASVALGACYALRLVADSGTRLEWLRWATPLGWVEELQPITAPRPLALLPVAALTALLAGLAVYLAGHRDLASSVWPGRATTRAHTRLLSGPTGLAARLAGPAAVGWAIAIAASSLLEGFIAKQGGSALTTSATVERALARLGASGGSARAYLGFAMLAVAVMVGFAAAGQVSAARAEEADGHLDHLLARPVPRSRWLAGRAGVATALLMASGLLAGLFAWAGAASQGSGVGLASLLDAGANVVPPSLCVLGTGFFTLGTWPRATTAVTYGVLAWSLLIEVVAGAVSSDHWVLDTSVFHQMASAPATAPDWASGAVLVLVGAVATGLGSLSFSARDLVGP